VRVTFVRRAEIGVGDYDHLPQALGERPPLEFGGANSE
jgi:hypothetical protein